MSGRPSSSMRFLVVLYRALLRLLPRRFRQRNAEEMERLFRDVLAAAALEPRRWSVARRALREYGDVMRIAWSLRIRSFALTARYPPRPTSSIRLSRGVAMSGLARDLRHTLRGILRHPGWALLTAATLAFGIGATTTIFAVVDAVLLRPLPYPNAERLVMVWRTVPQFGMSRAPISYPSYLDWRDGAPGFEELAAVSYGAAGTLLTQGGEPERIQGVRVSGNFFRVLGSATALGRGIDEPDDRPEAEPVIVLSHELWQRRFGGGRDVLDRTLRLDDRLYRVVGVMPAGFEFPTARYEFWTPLRLSATETERDANFLSAVGLLRSGIRIETAEAQVQAVHRRLAAAYPDAIDADEGVRVESRRDAVVGEARPVLVLLFAAVGLLLLVACANAANLMLLRSTTRGPELALRSALGAGSVRLVREQLLESGLVAVAAGLLGAMIASGATRALRLLGPGALPRRDEIALEPRALLFAAALSALCALACGLLPAWRAARRPAQETLRDGGRGEASRGVRRLQGALVVVQIATALVLLVGSGLLANSLLRLLDEPPGFDAERVLSVQLSLPAQRYGDPELVAAFYDELLRRVAALPGARAAGATWALPFGEHYASGTYVRDERPEPDPLVPAIVLAPVRGDFFRAIGVRLLRGRAFTSADTANAPPVIVVNETLARLFWPGDDPLGKQIVEPEAGQDAQPLTVVGVVADVKRHSLYLPPEPEAYQPHDQAAWTGGDLYLALRTDGDPLALAPAVRQAIRELDPQLPVLQVAAVSDLVARTFAEPRFLTTVLGSFSTLAALLGVIGVYGVLALATALRRRDIAVRMALGAARTRVLREVLGGGMRLVAIGVLLGLAGALVATRALATLLFEITPLDVPTYAVVVAALCVAAATACWIPARRAARMDAVVVLREE